MTLSAMESLLLRRHNGKHLMNDQVVYDCDLHSLQYNGPSRLSSNKGNQEIYEASLRKPAVRLSLTSAKES